MGNNRNRGHHTVPRLYLKNFSQQHKKGGEIIVANFRQNKIYPTNISKASIQTDFYSLDSEVQEQTGLPESAFEELLSSFESPASIIIDKVINDKIWPLDKEDRDTLAEFIALQFVRGQNQRDNVDNIANHLLKIMIAMKGKENVPESIWKSIQDDTLNVKLAPTSHTLSLFKDAEQVLPYINNRVWILVRFEKETLITCDAPVVIVPPLNANSTYRAEGVGVGNASALYFPLGRRVGLMMIHRSHFDELPAEIIQDLVQTGSSADAKAYNKEISKSARYEIFCHPNDKKLLPHPLPKPRGATLQAYGPSPADWISLGETMQKNRP